MKQQLITIIENQLQIGGRYLLAVSGGLDSCTLMHCCNQLKSQMHLNLAIAHVNHGLRKEAQQDLGFVQNLCTQYELPFFSVNLAGDEVRSNIENWARKERYRFLQEVCKQENYDLILTAHTSSDCVETLLMRLLSNKEPRGILRYDQRRKLLRPLLQVSRTEVAEYAKLHGLAFVEDSSNSNNDFLRNRVRNLLLPVIQNEFGSAAIDALLKRANALAEDQLLLDDLANQIVNDLGKNEFGSQAWLRMLKQELADQPQALRWRIVRAAFDLKLGFTLGRKNASRLVDFVLGTAQGLQLNGGWELKRKAGGVLLEKLQKDKYT